MIIISKEKKVITCTKETNDIITVKKIVKEITITRKDPPPIIPVNPFNDFMQENSLAWFKADSEKLVLSEDNKVIEWLDNLGRDFNFNNTTEASQPLFGVNQLNGKDTLNFNGSKRLFGSENLYNIPNGDNTVYILCNRFSISDTASVLDGRVGAAVRLYGFRTQSSAVGYFGQGNNNISNAPRVFMSPNNTAWRIYRGRKEGATLGMRVNSGTENTNNNGINQVINLLTLGVQSNGADAFNADIAEIMFFDKVLTSEQDALVMSYFNEQWGV